MAPAVIHKCTRRGRVETERRRYPRGAPHGNDRARLRPGGDVRLLDVSAGGALVEGDSRMAPGASVELRLPPAASAVPVVRARVIRCSVSALIGAESVRYAAALEFNHIVEWLPHLLWRGRDDHDGPARGERWAG